MSCGSSVLPANQPFRSTSPQSKGAQSQVRKDPRKRSLQEQALESKAEKEKGKTGSKKKVNQGHAYCRNLTVSPLSCS